MKKTSVFLSGFFLFAAVLSAEPAPPESKPAAAASPADIKDEGPSPEMLILKLRDADPEVRAQHVALAKGVAKQDYRVIDALSRIMDNPSEAPLVRLDAACIVGTQDSPYAFEGSRRAAALFDELGYPNDRWNQAQAAVVRPGDAIIPELQAANQRGRLSNRFFQQVMERIGTDAARVALDRSKSHQSGADRHTVNR